MYNVDVNTRLMADINIMDREKNRFSYTRKPNAPNSLCNHAVWSVSLSVLTLKYSRLK